MAVKVIDPTPDPAIVKRITCGGCGARLEYVPNDVEQRSVSDYTGDRDITNFIRCPNCKKEIVTSYW